MVYDVNNDKINQDSKVVNFNYYKLNQNNSNYNKNIVFGGLSKLGNPVYGSKSMKGLVKRLYELSSNEDK